METKEITLSDIMIEVKKIERALQRNGIMGQDDVENIEMEVRKKKPLLVKDVFGMLKEWKRPTQEIKDGMRVGWLSGSDREREKKWRKKE